MLLHATCITIDGRAVLLTGPSGSGKSDLALRLCTGVQALRGRILDVRLVSDDQVQLANKEGRLIASPPPAIAGMIEARGIGILKLPFIGEAEVKLAVSLAPDGPIERMPDPPARSAYLGVQIPHIRLLSFENSTPAKVALAVLQEP